MLTTTAQFPLETSNLTADQIAVRFLLGYSGNTREAYSADLKKWFAFCAQHYVDPLAASRASVDAYARQLVEVDNRAGRSVNRALAALSGFYGYALDEEVIARNPVSRVRRQKVSEEMSSTGLTTEETQRLLRAAKSDGKRSEALISLLVMNGLRITEALNACIEDLGSERGMTVLRIQRKGGKWATIPLSEMVAGRIQELVQDRTEGYIFLSSQGTALNRSSAWRLVRKLARQALPDKAHTLHPHDLRHTFVTLSLDAGASLREVQDAAGHADPRTTRGYDRARNRLDTHPTFRLNLSLGT